MSKHQLLCVSIIELDVNGDVITAWKYPSIQDDLEKVITQRCPLIQRQLLNENDEESNVEDGQGNVNHFMYSKYQDINLYTLTKCLKEPFNQVASFSICLCAKDYFPKMYQQVVNIFADVYLKALDPVQVLQAYISIFGSGRYQNEFNSTQFDKRKSKLGQVKMWADLFGEEEFCRIWTAVLLRKRVLIYSDKVSDVLTLVDACPSLCWHRANSKQQYNNFIRPFVNLNSEVELHELEHMGVFIAGIITEPKNLRYDLYVDVPRRTCTVSEEATNDFKLSKLHRDLYSAVKEELDQQEQENKASNQAFIKVVATTTMEIIDKLKSIKESNSGALDLETLKSVSKQPDTQRFLYNIALSEGLLELHAQPQQQDE